MAKHEATTAIVLDTRKKRKDDRSLVKIRVTHNRVQRYYATRYAYTPDEFQRVMQGARVTTSQKEDRVSLSAIEQKAIDIINALPAFSFDLFERRFIGAKGNVNDVFFIYGEKIKELTEEGRVRNRIMYENSRDSIRAFAGKDKLPFETITPKWLYGYEVWMLKQGRSKATIGMYLRSLRHLFNKAISDGDIEASLYPFGDSKKGKYTIPTGGNVKKALTIAEVMKIYHYKPIEGSTAHYARDMWLFSYLASGINMMDIARLKWGQIGSSTIEFERSKTARTTRQHATVITIPITPDLRQILERWGTAVRLPGRYVFPILQPDIDPDREIILVKQFTKTVNKYIKRIAKELGITADVSTYYARHSFATILMQQNAPVALISKSLGHASISTTESYLGSFESEALLKYAEGLIKDSDK